MSNFCGSCGTPMVVGAKRCAECGGGKEGVTDASTSRHMPLPSAAHPHVTKENHPATPYPQAHATAIQGASSTKRWALAGVVGLVALVLVAASASRFASQAKEQKSPDATVLAAESSPFEAKAELASTSPLEEVEMVKDGVLAAYNSTTIGKAFDATFKDPKWTSFISPKGATVVQFNGVVRPKPASVWQITEFRGGVMDGQVTIPPGLLHPAIEACVEKLGLGEEMMQEAKAGDYWLLNTEYRILRQTTTHPERIEQIKACMNQTLSIPVSFQFTLSADRKDFKLSYIDQPLFEGHEDEAIEYTFN
jgi:hypothetical protein